MPVESVVLEEPISTDTEAPDADLVDFNWESYTQYFNDATSTYLTEMLSQRKYGWKSRARMLVKIAHAVEYATRLKDDLEESCTGESKPRGPRKLTPRDNLRNYLTALTNEQLEVLAHENSVSYASFMQSNDRVGLIESIIDEMPTAS